MKEWSKKGYPEGSPVVGRQSYFAVCMGVMGANPNGDPMNENSPRMSDGYGQMTNVCINRKTRNRMMEEGYPVLVVPEDRCRPGYQWYDGHKTLKDRAEAAVGNITNSDECYDAVCKAFLDVRTFGGLFPFSSDKKGGGSNLSVHGPVTVGMAQTVHPVHVRMNQIVKSVDNEKAAEKVARMGRQYIVPFGLYVAKGAVNPLMARATGFTEADEQVLKHCLRTLFLNDASAARPAGTMRVVKLIWWTQKDDDAVCSAAQVHDSLVIGLKEGVKVPTSFDDYTIDVDGTKCPGMDYEILDGI